MKTGHTPPNGDGPIVIPENQLEQQACERILDNHYGVKWRPLINLTMMVQQYRGEGQWDLRIEPRSAATQGVVLGDALFTPTPYVTGTTWLEYVPDADYPSEVFTVAWDVPAQPGVPERQSDCNSIFPEIDWDAARTESYMEQRFT